MSIAASVIAELVERVGGVLETVESVEAAPPSSDDEKASIVERFAEAEALLEKAKRLRDKVRADMIALHEQYGLKEVQSDLGRVVVTKRNGSARLDTKKVRQFLTEEQIKEATVVGKPTYSVRFIPNKERLLRG